MRTRRMLVEEQGAAMVLVVFATALLTLLGITMIDRVLSEEKRSAGAVKSQSAFQAAEAGIDDYVSKLVDDHTYYLHYVHAAEATRRPTSGADVAAGGVWNAGTTWSYPNGNDAWRQLSNGYEYSLKVTAPTAGSTSIGIVAVGRRIGSTTDRRRIEALIRPSNLADFYRLSDDDVNWGATASTYGKIYVNGDTDHKGTAYGDIYAEGSITGPPTMISPAKKYSSADTNSNGTPDIREKIKNPINFASFLVSFTDIKRAAQVGGLYLAGSATTVWRLTFASNGTVAVQDCTVASAPEDVNPTSCIAQPGSPFPVPPNGAIYTEHTAIVSGQVNGRVTVGSSDDIVVSNALGPAAAGDDVLGLAAYNNLWVAKWAPNVLTWTAAVLVQNDTWNAYPDNANYNDPGGHGTGSTMNFYGSSATKTGGSFGAYQFRNYNYDPTLLYLPPPWFPSVGDTYTVNLFRELPAT